MPSQEVIDGLWGLGAAVVFLAVIVGLTWFIVESIMGRWSK